MSAAPEASPPPIRPSRHAAATCARQWRRW